MSLPKDVEVLAMSIHSVKSKGDDARFPYKDCGGNCIKEAQEVLARLNQDHRHFIVDGEWLDRMQNELVDYNRSDRERAPFD